MAKTKNGKRDEIVLSQQLKKEWAELCEQYLPITTKSSIWRFNRIQSPDDPKQGWKLHLSATILSANKMLRKVAPFLYASGVSFKATVSLQELGKLNSGLYYGFSQVGKFITVYARTGEEAVRLAEKLHKLTLGLSGPPVPYDLPFRKGGCVYYRYGAFSSLEIENSDGTRTPAILDPNGEMVPDQRAFGFTVPSWQNDPFRQARRRKKGPAPDSPLKIIKAYEALSQRGKGGVYRALDLTVIPARLCILKEGRRHGETDWDGRDGYWRVRHEAQVLSALLEASIKVPEVYTTFEVSSNYYLVIESIEGKSLQSLMVDRRKKLPVLQALNYGIQLAELIDKIHSAGWVWRDCKPLNLMVSNDGPLIPVDFEGACRIDTPDIMPWGTPGYSPPDQLEKATPGSKVPEDLFALGATLHQLLSGRTPDLKHPPPIGKLRRRVPETAKKIISALLNSDPQSRPDARMVARALKSAALEITGKAAAT